MRRTSENPPSRFPARPVREAGHPWFVAHLKPRQEKAAADDCIRFSIEYYLPMYTRVTRRRDNNKPRKSLLPLFPGYICAAGTKETERALWSTGRIANIIEIRNQKKFMDELGQIYSLLESGAPLEPCAGACYANGGEVVIRNGPFRGIRGTITGVRGRRKLLLSVEGLGTAMTEVDGSAVVPFDNSGEARKCLPQRPR